MKQFIPYEKLSKKQQRETDRQKRGAWGEINPITRCPDRSNEYDRQKENRRWKVEVGVTSAIPAAGLESSRYVACRILSVVRAKIAAYDSSAIPHSAVTDTHVQTPVNPIGAFTTHGEASFSNIAFIPIEEVNGVNYTESCVCK